MSKRKKTPQKNLSLKERLAKHWDNRNWDLFVALFSRDRDASMRTPWAGRWNDALYNSLTKALFVDKNSENAEATLALINEERDAYGLSASLSDCAGVASDFLSARKNAFLKELSPLKAEAAIPAAYADLREKLSLFTASSAKARKAQKAKKDGPRALIEKFAAQYAKLGRAQTVTPYTAWLKTAEQLESLSKGTENERTFSAVRAIVALTRELFLTGRGENSLRDPESLLESKLFSAVPPRQTYPSVKALWNFFCSAGERKYGAEWGEAARVLQLSFMAEDGRSTLRTQYYKLMNSGNYGCAYEIDTLAADLIRSSSTWTEQELYVLNAIFVETFVIGRDKTLSVITRFLEAFNLLTRIGRKWRPEAPWAEGIRRSFDKLLMECPFDTIQSAITDIPYETLSPHSLVMMSFHDGKLLKVIEKAASNRLPLSLGKESIKDLGDYLAQQAMEASPRGLMQVLKALLDRRACGAVLTRLACKIIEKNAIMAHNGEPPSQQPWTRFSSKGVLEEMAELLPHDNYVGCFCRLCSGMPPCRISSEPSKINAFLASLRPETEEEHSVCFLIFLLTWPDIDPEFIVRLFERSYIFRDKKNRTKRDGVWLELVALIERMANEADRGVVALGILRLTAWDGRKKSGASFKKAMEALERLGNPKGLKEAKSSFGKARSIVKNITGQGVLPFDND